MSPETRTVSVKEDGWLEAALAAFMQGGLVAFPTDTVYGVGGMATNGEVVEAIYQAKDRPVDRSIPVLVGGWTDLEGVALPPPRAERLAAAFWPGPLTIVVPRDQRLPAAIGPGTTVGVRAPAHAAALALVRAAGPLATSSANRSGEPSPLTALEVMGALEGRIDLVVDGGKAPGGRPSTVVDCTGDRPVLVRAGPVSLEDVLRVWD
jgi:L-threonylcarbamoyladenylate synthase